MRIENWDTSEHGDAREVSADVDGYRLWFRVPRRIQVSATGDAFLAVALLPAMRLGEDVMVAPELTISPKLLAGLASLQDVFHCWNPNELRKIRIQATPGVSAPANAGAMCFFSGGVDSTYTFLKRHAELTHAVNIHGFDFFSRDGDRTTLSAADLKDLSQLAWKLSHAQGAVSDWLTGALPRPCVEAVRRYAATGGERGRTEQVLAEALKEIVAGGPIYDSKRFAGVALRPETTTLLARAPRGAELARLNRMLLEDAFPMEILREDGDVYAPTFARNAAFVASQGKALVTVETNLYPFGYRYNLGRNLTQGSCLSSVALLLGFPRAYIPSAHSYRYLHPLGSHPLTDPLFSSDSVTIVHDGAEVERKDKLPPICACPPALDNLRVCADDPNVNCGVCDKCLRTMIDLRLLRAGPGPFPPIASTRLVRKMAVLTNDEVVYMKGHLALAAEADDPALRRALRICDSKNALLRLAITVDKELLGGMAKRSFRRLRPNYGVRRINATPVE